MIWLFLSGLLFPMLYQWASAQGAGREPSQDSWPELVEGIFHTLEHAQYINWGELYRSCRSVTGQWVMKNCIVRHLSFWGFITLYHYFCGCCCLLLLWWWRCILCHVLNCSYINICILLFFQIFLSAGKGGGVSGWLCGSWLPAVVKPWQMQAVKEFHNDLASRKYLVKGKTNPFDAREDLL